MPGTPLHLLIISNTEKGPTSRRRARLSQCAERALYHIPRRQRLMATTRRLRKEMQTDPPDVVITNTSVTLVVALFRYCSDALMSGAYSTSGLSALCTAD